MGSELTTIITDKIKFMEQVLEVFFNGIGGVFAGMAVLYLAIRLLTLMPDKQTEDKEE